PKRVRERLGIVPGSRVEFEMAEDGRVVIVKAGEGAPKSRFEQLRGIAGPGPSTAELMALLRG
ncbi:MAG: AbrB/MazE/SpoVT family DNA-binding domain-containing protein, partial [Caulobacteraceae bacterium]